MQLNVIFSDQAVDTFDAIGKQLQERWGDKELNAFRNRTYAVIEIIGKFPLVFQAVNKTPNVRKAFIHKNCSMFYELKRTSIEVLFF